MNRSDLLQRLRSSDEEEALQAALELQDYYQDANHALAGLLLRFFPALLRWQTVMGDIKATDKIIDKVRVRTDITDISQLTDVARGRIVVPSLESFGRGEVMIYSMFGRTNVIDRDFYVVTPTDKGYRAVHYVVRINGLPVEIQVMTPGQHAWASWNHPRGYKGDYIGNSEFQDYARKLSNRIFALELGLGHEEVRRPTNLPEDANFPF